MVAPHTQAVGASLIEDQAAMLVEYAQRPSSAWWQLWLDDVREVPLIHVRSDLELAAGHGTSPKDCLW